MSTRHSWTKLKLHDYMCNRCGMGKRNTQDPSGGWFATFFKSDGTEVVSSRVPPCEVGPLTDERLAWMKEWNEAGSRPPLEKA